MRTVYFSIRKWLQPGRQVSAPPYHIFLSNRKNQRELFRTCGLQELLFRIAEDPWPFRLLWPVQRVVEKSPPLLQE
ncbi:MAG: hypothetical protein IPP99_01155 [Chitinophagaceae bacterium]|nr:hypothetical protein [Chitinophagaceae bacterium]